MKSELSILTFDKAQIENDILKLKKKISAIDQKIRLIHQGNKSDHEKEAEVRNLLDYAMDYHSKSLWQEALARCKNYFPDRQEILGLDIAKQLD